MPFSTKDWKVIRCPSPGWKRSSCSNSCYKTKTMANDKSSLSTNFRGWIPLVPDFFQPSRTSGMAGVVAGTISCLWFAVVLLPGFSVIYQEAKEDSTDA